MNNLTNTASCMRFQQQKITMTFSLHSTLVGAKFKKPMTGKNNWNVLSSKYTCSGPPAFKTQRVGYQSSQKSLHHYQHSTNNFILKIQQILGSHELKGHCHFWPCPPKNNWINFLLSCKKIMQKNQFITSLLRYSQF